MGKPTSSLALWWTLLEDPISLLLRRWQSLSSLICTTHKCYLALWSRKWAFREFRENLPTSVWRIMKDNTKTGGTILEEYLCKVEVPLLNIIRNDPAMNPLIHTISHCWCQEQQSSSSFVVQKADGCSPPCLTNYTLWLLTISSETWQWYSFKSHLYTFHSIVCISPYILHLFSTQNISVFDM